MSLNRASSRKQKKRKERERRIAHARNLRRNAPVEIEDAPAEPEDEAEQEPPELLPQFDAERLMRYAARRLGGTSIDLPAFQEALAAAQGRSVSDLVAEIAPDDLVEQAQELAFQAQETLSPGRADDLVRQALALDPDCVDALRVLAILRPRTSDQIEGLRRAVAAGERRLRETGPALEVLKWPYARARMALAVTLATSRERGEAVVHFRALVDEDPADHNEARYPLISLHLEQGDAGAARELLQRFSMDNGEFMRWARVLERYLAGDRAGASHALRRARRTGGAFEDGLLGCSEGDGENDRSHALKWLRISWLTHQNAVEWLAKGGPETVSRERRAAYSTYSPPVADLLRRGNVFFGKSWRTEGRLTFAVEHVPELVRMATDRALHESAPDSLEVCAPMLAWRALACMGAVEAIDPLAQFLRERFEDEWTTEELAWVFTEFGPPAIPAMVDLVQDHDADDEARGTAAAVLRGIAEEHPECRDEAVATLRSELERYRDHSLWLNSDLVHELVALRACDAGDLIRQAFEDGMVDERNGSWEDVKADLDEDAPR